MRIIVGEAANGDITISIVIYNLWQFKAESGQSEPVKESDKSGERDSVKDGSMLK